MRIRPLCVGRVLLPASEFGPPEMVCLVRLPKGLIDETLHVGKTLILGVTVRRGQNRGLCNALSLSNQDLLPFGRWKRTARSYIKWLDKRNFHVVNDSLHKKFHVNNGNVVFTDLVDYYDRNAGCRADMCKKGLLRSDMVRMHTIAMFGIGVGA